MSEGQNFLRYVLDDPRKFIHIAYTVFLELNRNADTLLPIIEQYIRPNTEIHSDLWRAYGGIRALPEGYIHLQVNHSVHFEDPDTQACTKHVENMWKNAKISHKTRCGKQ